MASLTELYLTKSNDRKSAKPAISRTRPVKVTSITLQDTCRSVRDAFFTDWSDRHHWTVEVDTSLNGRFKCLATRNRIEFGHDRFRDRDALRATIMSFYALARNNGRKDPAWEQDMRKLAGKASFIGRYWLACYMNELADKLKLSRLPAVYLDPGEKSEETRSDCIDLCFLSWPLALDDTPGPNVEPDAMYDDSLRPKDFVKQLMREAS